MDDPFGKTPDSKKVKKVAIFLQKTFSRISPAVAHLHAQTLVQSPEWAPHLHHEGAKDRAKLISFQKTIKKMEQVVSSLSPWSQTALETLLHQNTLGGQVIREIPSQSKTDLPRPALTVEEFLDVIQTWKSAALGAEKLLEKGRPGHGKNYRAIVLIDDTRRLWKLFTGKSAPPRELNPNTDFAEFLVELFKQIGIGAGVERAYDAWYDVASDPNSILDPPDER